MRDEAVAAFWLVRSVKSARDSRLGPGRAARQSTDVQGEEVVGDEVAKGPPQRKGDYRQPTPCPLSKAS
jgi:hypothetical protein